METLRCRQDAEKSSLVKKVTFCVKNVTFSVKKVTFCVKNVTFSVKKVTFCVKMVSFFQQPNTVIVIKENIVYHFASC